ncbi:MAG: ATP-dependent helicase Lhr and Lhr-like helicase [Chloroflexota bacterium]|nr:ATP-dependent helicase Lhr and Lhr-like helicase [Chloroflexota bacterium]
MSAITSPAARRGTKPTPTKASASAGDPLAPFSAPVRAWFESAFETPTPAQVGGWASISTGRHTLIHAPTGSGKTLAAFLWCLDRLARDPSPPPSKAAPGSVRVLYVSPLKALTYDVERNLRSPLHGIALAAQRLGVPEPRISIAGRTGDTPQEQRRELARRPPDILVTTPESLYLLLTSAARETLRGVETVIIDEVHAIAGTKRGAHLVLSLERLERLRPADAAPMQRIGLSATQRPLETIARFLGGIGPGRDVEIVDAGSRKALDLEVIVPVEDMARLGEVLPPDQQPGGPVAFGEMRSSIWPAIHPRLLELIRAHRSTIIFTNSRRLAERLAQRLNELAGEELVRAHHGSIAREQRLQIEEDLKAGRIPALVATSSLELGIDMGAVDLVVLVESPTSVASGLQRVGRAGHQVGEPSKGIVFPKFRGDLLESAVVVKRMHQGAIETTVMPHNPLDVLAQQLVAMTVMDPWTVAELLEVVNRAAPFETLSREALEAVLGMLAGAYPSDEFAELKARVVWDRVTDIVQGRRDARVVAVTSGGTIPDRGLFGVFLAGETGTPGRRVGELDEEMVYELRAGMHGDVIVLGASSWRVLDITPDRVIVEPSPGVPGKLPFWKGDAVGRPVELGRAIGGFLREAEGDLARGERGHRALTNRLRSEHDLDELAANNLVAYLDEEREIAGALPTDKRLVVQRFRDELGDWRLVILSPFGGRVHAPLTLAIETRLRERLGIEAQTIWSDDGIAVRLPEGEGDGSAARLAEIEALLFPAAEEIEDLVVEAVGGSALFASRFRENAGRALLLPRRRPGARTPLWQQRQRAADLLQVASRYGSFPILVETYRECLSDVFDLDALREILGGIERREIAIHGVETAKASPFASSLLFDYVAAYMYEGDAPLAERRAGALALDRDLLRELLGQEELRELLDPEALADLELSLQSLTEERQANSVEHLHDLLRRIGDLSAAEIAARVEGGAGGADAWLRELAATRRAVAIRIAGDDRWIAIEDAGRYRDGVGASPPAGVPEAFLVRVDGALESLLARFARSHGPFLATEPASRWGLPLGVVEDALGRLAAAGTVLRGEFRPTGSEREWCDPEVLRHLRRRSLARLRREVEPVDPETLGRFLPAWQGVIPVGSNPPALRGSAALERLAEVVDQLSGVPIPASVLEREVLPARVAGYQPRLLDELGALGEVAWVGHGSLGRDDGRVVLHRPGRELLLPGGSGDGATPPDEPLHRAIRDHLETRGASFFRAIQAAAGRSGSGAGGAPERQVLDALWDLVWAGQVTNDTFAPLRALRWKRPSRTGTRATRGPGVGRLTSLGPPEAAGRWSLVGSGVWDPAPAVLSPTERLHQLALALLDRHGVLVREAVMAEGHEGGFSAVYPMLRALEEAGRIRRGYFVEGLGAAQFALAGALDRLRAVREPASTTGDAPVVHLLAAADPANPYGAAVPWPRRGEADRRPFQRAAGASVVLVDGVAALYLDRGGSSLQTLPAFDDPAIASAALASLGNLLADGSRRELVISRVDGEPVGRSPWYETLLRAGFIQGYRGVVMRRVRVPAMIA